MFFGRYEHKVDTKGRVQIPIALRRADEDKIYSKFTLVRGIDGCLALFTKEGFDRFRDAYMSGNPGREAIVNFQRDFYSRMVEIELDSQGRLLLPRLQREEVGIDGKVLFLGAGEWIEIWDTDRYEEYSRRSETSYDEIARHFFATLGRKQPDQSENVGDR